MTLSYQKRNHHRWIYMLFISSFLGLQFTKKEINGSAIKENSKMFSIPQLESCCCGCSLKTGSKIIGWLHLVGSILATITTVSMLAALYYIMENKDMPVTPDVEKIRAFFGVLKITAILLILMYLVSSAFGLILLLGIYQNKAKMVFIWVVAAVTMTVIETLITVTQMILIYEASGLINIFFFFLNIYFIWVVYSFYRSIENVSSNYA